MQEKLCHGFTACLKIQKKKKLTIIKKFRSKTAKRKVAFPRERPTNEITCQSGRLYFFFFFFNTYFSNFLLKQFFTESWRNFLFC